MTGSTHKIGGFTFGLIFITFNLYMPTLPIMFISVLSPFFLIGCILGALFPDIDSPMSTISRLLWFIAWPIWLFQKIIRFIFKKGKSKFAKNICKTVGHRGIAHWISLALVYIVAIYLLYLNVEFRNLFTFEIFFECVSAFIYGTAIGNLSHIVLDSFNDTGIPLLAPLSFKRISFAKVVTGKKKRKKSIFTDSLSENIFIIILLIICLSLLIYNFQII